MTIRPTQSQSFDQVRRSLELSFQRLIRTQEEVSSGKKILRPSDDPVGTASSLSLSRQLGELDRYRAAIGSARPVLDAGMSALDEAGGLVAQARELVVQGLNGSLSDDDRRTLGQQVRDLRDRLLQVGNARSGEHYLFGGTRSASAPFEEAVVRGERRVVYVGDRSVGAVSVGAGARVE